MRKRLFIVQLAAVALISLLLPASPAGAIKVYLNPSIQSSNHSPDLTYVESTGMQDVAAREAVKFLDRGFEVRNGGWLDPWAAADDAYAWGANCFISNHTNACGNNDTGWHTCRGTETYYHLDANGWYLPGCRDMAQRTLNKCVEKFNGNGWGRGYSRGMIGNDLGITAYWKLQYIDMCLVEGLFHDNQGDLGVLNSDAGRDAYAQALFEATCDHYGWAYSSWASTYRAQSYPATMVAGSTATAWVEYNNTGNTHWFQGGKVRLGTQGPQDRNSPFFTSGDWDSASRPGALDQADVGPTGVGRCTFTLTAPTTPGTYTEQFKLVREGITWFGDTITWTITVTPSDSTPPSTPTNVSADPLSHNSVHLTWTASTDNVGVTGYEVWRNGAVLASLGNQTSYDDNTGSGNTTYTYQVRARDAVGNWSGLSTSAVALTWSVIAQDNFASLNQWTAGTIADGTTRGVSLDTGTGNPAAPSARSDTGANNNQGSYSYVGVAAPFAVANAEVTFYDSATTGNSRNGIGMRKFNGTAARLVYFLGNDQTNSTTVYSPCAYGAGAGWVKHTTGGSRAVGWRRLKVTLDGTNALYYVDGALKDTIAMPAEKGEGIDRFYIGNNYNVSTNGWYDEFVASAPIPPVPSAGAASGITTGGITWNWTEGAKDNEQGFNVEDTGGAIKATAARNVLTAAESGLAANTLYTRKVTAWNGTLESSGSGNMTATTLSIAPSTGNISSVPATGVATTGVFTFTSGTSFGAGGVQYYRYAFDTSATHSWTASEAQWTGGSLVCDVSTAGSYYLHLKGYNSAGVENGTLDLGPYVYAAPAAPTGVVATSADWNISHVTWTASSDPLGVTNYEIWRNGTALTTVSSAVTSFDDSGLSQGTTYSYQVRAKNGANHWSDLSAAFGVKTWSLLLDDPFASMGSWTASKTADGTVRGLSLDTGTGSSLGGGSGAPSAKAVTGGGADTNGCYSYSGVTGTTFAIGYVEASVYDSATSGAARHGISFRKSVNDDISTTRLIYFLGTESYNMTNYNCQVYGQGGGWVKHATGGARTIGWHRFRVAIDGTNATFYVDGALKDTIAQPAEKTDGVNRWYIGHNYNCYINGWYDDFRACLPTPPTPSPAAASGVTSTSITWNWTEGPSDYEQGFNLKDTGGAVKGSAGRNAFSFTETGLAPNTQYTRVITAYNGSLESPVSVTVTATTLP